MAYKFNSNLKHLVPCSKHSLSTNSSFRTIHSNNFSFSNNNVPPLSGEDEALLKLAVNEYADLFPKILQIPQSDFIPTLERFVLISLKGKGSYNGKALAKVLSIIKQTHYDIDYNKLKACSAAKITSLKKLETVSYIPHCNHNAPPIHKCGNHLHYLSPSYLYCHHCNAVYTTTSLCLYCAPCGVEFYTRMLTKHEQELQFKQATWNRYHCNVLFNEPMKCPKCKEALYINTKNNKLACLECKYEFEQDKIMSKCVVCRDNFVSDAKAYNEIEYKNVTIAIKEAIFTAKEAKPDYLPCCAMANANLEKMKFVHKKECNGVLYEGKLNDKRIVVCSNCHLLSYRENHFWMCPICKERFKLDLNQVHEREGMYRKINVNRQLMSRRGGEGSADYTNNNYTRTESKGGKGRYNSDISTADNSVLNERGIQHMHLMNANNKGHGAYHSRYLSMFISNKNIHKNIFNNEDDSTVSVNNENGCFKKVNPVTDIKRNKNTDEPDHEQMHRLFKKTNYNSDNNVETNNKFHTPIKLARHSMAPASSSSAVTDVSNNYRSSRLNIQSRRESTNQLLSSFLERSNANASANININLNVNITATNMVINNVNPSDESRPPSKYKSNNLQMKHIQNITKAKPHQHQQPSTHNRTLTERNASTNKFNSDQFIIIRQIGEGTFGKIYEVKNSSDKTFAMKKILTSNPRDIEALNSEYQMLLNLNALNLNLVKIYGMHSKQLDKTTFVMYVLMELASHDWEREIRQRKSKYSYYTEAELINILAQLTNTFAELQLRKISHRDIKPQNILICNNGVFKVADFGEAKETINTSKTSHNAKDTVTQTIRGTELYMSPLLFKALKTKKGTRDKYIEHNTYKSDVFSLGLCMFLAATLNMQSLVDMREIDDTNKVRTVVNKWLKGRYSSKYVEVLLSMVEINEKKRVDFLELREMLSEISG